jgi:hypothetical protein
VIADTTLQAYRYRFVAKFSGDYQIRLTNSQIVQLGVSVNPGSFNASMSLIVSSFSVVAGQPTSLSITPSDSFGNQISPA